MFLKLLALVVLNIVISARTPLPTPINGAYTNLNQCDQSVVISVMNGVNVVFWFGINIQDDPETGLPIVTGGPDFNCVAWIVWELEGINLPIVHMVSIGGWGQPHITTQHTPEVVYASWKKWNEEDIAQPELGFYGFDGIDWIYSGMNDPEDPNNHFTVAELDLMGTFSQLAKYDGYYVSLAPQESYFDVTTGDFDLSLLNSSPEFPDFSYKGRNCYTYLQAKYTKTGDVNTFDWISIQLYETYSNAFYNISILNQPASEYFINYIPKLYEGWYVDFENATELNFASQVVSIEPMQTIIFLPNAWTSGSDRALYVEPSEVGIAYETLKNNCLENRGFAFYCIDQEGIEDKTDGESISFATEFNKFLHTSNYPNYFD